MKMNFEEPKLTLEQFSVTDLLTASNWSENLPIGPDETNPIGGLNPIGDN